MIATPHNKIEDKENKLFASLVCPDVEVELETKFVVAEVAVLEAEVAVLEAVVANEVVAIEAVVAVVPIEFVEEVRIAEVEPPEVVNV